VNSNKILYMRFFIIFFLGYIFISQSLSQTKDQNKYWIFFKDKGPQRLEKMSERTAASNLGISPRAWKRRSKVDKPELIDNLDVPVYEGYLQGIEKMGLIPVAFSRWLNAVSVMADPEMIKKIKSLTFVKRIQPVASFTRKPPEPGEIAKPKSQQAPGEHTYDYGPSFDQNNQIRIPEVHDLGLDGKGVLIGMIDSGFDYQGKKVFSHLGIVGEYDFYWDDSTTADQENDPSYPDVSLLLDQDSHGTQTLSVIGGFWEGYLIGPAFGASFMLAKTEWLAEERRIEEDHWVEAIEWMEREGVDIVSSSLGYGVFVDDGFSYSYEDLDGNTCVTTVAADIAAAKGVLVVNSAGNRDFWEYVNSPADGDSVIAVGAVDFTGERMGFSSIGPTYDGRTKPDVMAMGGSVIVTDPITLDAISGNSGTSFSCPLVAGVCALVLQAHPELGPMQVRKALRETADRAQNPDNFYGWGLVDAYEAVFYHGMVFTNFTSVDLIEEDRQGLDVTILWKYGIDSNEVYLQYKMIGGSSFTSLKMESVPSENNVYRAVISGSLNVSDFEFYVGPVGAPEVLYEGPTSIHSPQKNIDKTFELSQNYPNPFNGHTYFPLILTRKAQVTMHIYNIVGQRVKTIYSGMLNKGVYNRVFGWDGTDQKGITVTSGIYILQTSVEKAVQTCKIIYVK